MNLTFEGAHKGLTAMDALIALCVIGVLAGVAIPRYQRNIHAAREAAVKAELTNIRTSLHLYRLLNGRNPGSLHEMLEKQVLLPAQFGNGRYGVSFLNRTYLAANAVDSRGDIIDSFGNPFAYDPVRGEVKSTTDGYEAW